MTARTPPVWWLGPLLAAALSVLCAGRAGASADPFDQGTMDRVAEAWPDVLEAAAVTDTDPLLLAAVAVGETGMRHVRGGERDAMWGAGQVRWATWGALLREEGVAEEADDLLDQRAGLMATAVVLQHLRATYRRGGALTLCLYGAGSPALLFRRDCAYSRRALALRDGLRRALARSADGPVASADEREVGDGR